MTIASHIIFALFAVGFGIRNLIAKKGDNKHKVIGWIWVLLRLIVAGIFTLLPGRYLPNLIGIF